MPTIEQLCHWSLVVLALIAFICIAVIAYQEHNNMQSQEELSQMRKMQRIQAIVDVWGEREPRLVLTGAEYLRCLDKALRT